jgi:hypothetical protein
MCETNNLLIGKFLPNNPDFSNKEEFKKLEEKWKNIETLNVPGVRLAVSGSHARQACLQPSHLDDLEDYIPLFWSPTVPDNISPWWW